MEAERRTKAKPTTLLGYLETTPASVVLDRLDMPVLAVGPDGVILYANGAFADMIGSSADVAGRPLDDFVASARVGEPDAVAWLGRMAGQVMRWRHGEGHEVYTLVSRSLLRRQDDSVALLTFNDVTESAWDRGNRDG